MLLVCLTGVEATKTTTGWFRQPQGVGRLHQMMLDVMKEERADKYEAPSDNAGDGDDPTVEGETKRRLKDKVKRLNEWQENRDWKKRANPTEGFKPRKDDQTKQLYVHLITHTHDDLGWLKTVD